MKKSFNSVIIVAAGLVLACVISRSFGNPSVEAVAFHQTGATTGNGFTYYGTVSFTNGAGSIWIKPTNGVTSFTFSDTSGFPAPYKSVVIGMNKTTYQMYGTNTLTNVVTFAVATNYSYSLTLYVTNVPPPPTNGQLITMQLLENTN
jgi:hypothetical protein